MKQYKIEITKEALRGMEEIYSYIADAIMQLDTFPEKFRILRSENEKQKELHRMMVENYSIFYVIRENRVIITNVLYSASDIEEKLRKQITAEIKK